MSAPVLASNQVPIDPASNFALIFRGACDEYKKLTGHDLYSHPFAKELESCNSPDLILDVLRRHAETFIKRHKNHEKLLSFLNPIVNVLFMFSATLGEGLGLSCSPGKTIFTGIGVLLWAMRDVLASYGRFVCLFERVKHFLQRLDAYTRIPLTPAMTELLGKIMAQVLSILALSTKEMQERRIKRFLKRLMGRTDVEDALQRLDVLTGEELRMAVAKILEVAHRVDRNVTVVAKETRDVGNRMTRVEAATRSVNRNMQGTYAGVDMIRQRQLRGELRKWLSPPNPSTNHNAARDTQHTGTAKWFTEGRIFNEWKNDNTLLWISGNPGCGKSVLCSAVIEDLKPMAGSPPVLIAYYYFDFKDAAKRDLRGLLSSLLAQLGSDSDRCLHILSQLHMTCRDGSEQPGEESLAQCLKIMLDLPGQLPVYVIVDALDECPDTVGFPSARKKVLDFMTELIGAGHGNLHLCITSRPEQDIKSTLNSLAARRVSLHEEGGQREDINNYIRWFVHHTDTMRGWRDEDRELVITTLSERAHGMFRWVYCQLDTLRRCFPQSIRKALNDLPITLDDTYELALQRIAREKKEYAHRLFQCLVAAVRPLGVDELAEIFAVDFDPGSEPKLVDGWRPEDPEEAVLSACSTLITIVGKDDAKIVQFSHFSVKEFLTSDRFRISQLEKHERIPLYISLDDAHTILTRACLTVLLQLDEKLNKERLKAFPLAPYAARHWVDHAQIENVASRSQDPMERLFNPTKPHLVAWTRIHNIDKGNEPSANDLDDGEDRPLPVRASSLYYAALCGFAGVAEYLIAVHAQDVNAKCGHHGTPLHAASYGGHLEAAHLLVKRKADVTMTNGSKRTALCSAYDGGHLDVMQMLLQNGADVEERYAYSARLLHIASHHGEGDVVELLLRNRANADARDSVNQTPLHEASTNGHLKVVEILLDDGADVNAETNAQSTPLHGASEGGHLEVVRALLKRGADVRLRNRKNRRALEVATTSGRTEIMELLENAEKELKDTANMGPQEGQSLS